MSLIDFVNVTKQYENEHLALDGVNFNIETGDFVFVVGPSGAGKSTIIRLLIREEFPNNGEVIFDEQNVHSLSGDAISDLRRKIGVVFQDFKLLGTKTVFDNVAVALEVVDAGSNEIKNIVPNVLNMVGLSDKMHNYPHQLSGGEKQRVSIARALAHEPKVLIADEPTAMIDPLAADDLIDIFEKINSLGTTVIITTHNQAIVDKLKKRVLRVERGKVVSDKKGGKYNG